VHIIGVRYRFRSACISFMEEIWGAYIKIEGYMVLYTGILFWKPSDLYLSEVLSISIKSLVVNFVKNIKSFL